MTILHDNLYTKRAYANTPERNGYLSRAVWPEWGVLHGGKKNIC